jgi:hypothetical protein
MARRTQIDMSITPETPAVTLSESINFVTRLGERGHAIIQAVRGETV